MKILTTLKTFGLVALLGCYCLIANNASAQSQSMSTYSVLPETMITPPDQTPRILLVLDTSGSMQFDSTGTQVGAADTTSRSNLVRAAFREFLPQIEGDANVGLMVYGKSVQLETNWCHTLAAPWNGFCWPSGTTEWSYSDCNGYTSAGDADACNNTGNAGTVQLYDAIVNGKGLLLSNVEALDSAKIDELDAILQSEPVPPTLDSVPLVFGDPIGANIIDVDANFYRSRRFPYPDNATTLVNGVPISAGATPISGTLLSAKTYLNDWENLPAAEADIVNGDAVADPSTVPTGSVAVECRPDTYVFFLTDGLPTANETGGGDTSLVLPQQRAQELRDLGIPVWMFGFGIAEAEKPSINSIAQSGAGQDAFFSSNTAELVDQLKAAFQEINTNVASSSGLSVVASSVEGAGSVVQALYNPEIEIDTGVADPDNPGDTIKDTVYWTSTLNAFFIDEFGYFRQDDGDGVLEGYGEDQAFRISFNEVSQEVEAELITPTNIGADSFFEADDGTISYSALSPIWEAGSILSGHTQTKLVGLDTVNVYGEVQRDYDSVASLTNGYRHIIGWMEKTPGNSSFEDGNTLDFVYEEDGTNTINKINYLMFDPAGSTDAEKKEEVEKIVRFVRGEEGITGFRSRTANSVAYLLGDIVHSSSVQVGKPNQNFDSLGDDSYREFRDHWEDQDRRRMVYVGGNDGMLHAFNGGFWDGENKKFTISSSELAGETEHALGAEIWSYVPMNLLPHLKWLKDTGYNSASHVSFVDGAVQSFDVRIFDEDDDHINGWGTIIVVGMRFGGGDYPGLDYDAQSANALYEARSAYIILDVTNPEVPPIPLGEITSDSMKFTTSDPTVTRENCSDFKVCDWYLMMGSGPDQLATATSTIRQRLFRYKLDKGSSQVEGNPLDLDGGGSPRPFFRYGDASSFTGDLLAFDWDRDYETDAVYVGSISGDETTTDGGMYRYVVEDQTVNLLFDAGKAVPYKPLVKRFSGKNWVFFGTGRYLTIDDVDLNFDQNTFYGMYEPTDLDGTMNYDAVLKTDLSDVTAVDVLNSDGGKLKKNGTDHTVDTATTYSELRENILSGDKVGWYSDLDSPTPAAAPTRKTSATALSFRNFLFHTDFQPAAENEDQCSLEFGESFLNVVDLRTGTAPFIADFDGALGTDVDGFITDRTLLGAGYAYQSYLFIGPDPKTGKNRIVIKSPLSTGEVSEISLTLPPGKTGRTSWREIEIR